MSKLRKFLIALLIVFVVLGLLGWWLTRGDVSDVPFDWRVGVLV